MRACSGIGRDLASALPDWTSSQSRLVRLMRGFLVMLHVRAALRRVASLIPFRLREALCGKRMTMKVLPRSMRRMWVRCLILP